jgi:hypothetical protein
MSRPDDKSAQQQAWRELSEAGLVEIRLDQFAERIRDVKNLVIRRLRESLDLDSGVEARESAAYSLGALKGLEVKLLGNAPERQNPFDR